jgi:DNA-binding protein YbaB
MRNSGKWKDVWIDYQMLIESIRETLQDGATHHRLNALKKINKKIDKRMKQIKEEVKND